MESTGHYTVNTDIKLTELEQKIFNTLMEVVNEHQLKTTLRVAGGWVRDKLMGKESSDIDIALDDMFGEEFAKMINEKLHPEGKAKYGVIKSNSEKSKHLETATLKVHGFGIDLVNLRSEKYTQESRVPTIEIGTPEEDAFRRDLTINSLFYNINQQKVEDFTNRGIQDLKDGIIRTPLEPLQTFLDDPLRVLRTVRFATRFGFSILEDIYFAAKDENVLNAFATKVSYERLGKEMDLMLADKNPADSVKYLYDFNIIKSIYKLPDSCKELKDQNLVDRHIFESLKLSQVLGCLFSLLRQHHGRVNFAGLDYVIDSQDEQDAGKTLEQFKEFQRNTFYSALLFPFFPYEYDVKKGKKDRVVNAILYDSLKKSIDSMKFVQSTLPHIEKAVEFANLAENLQQLDDAQKLEIGNFLRESGNKWDSVLLLSIAWDYFVRVLRDQLDFSQIEPVVDEQQLQHVFCNNQHNLREVHLMKPLLDGKDICQIYEIKPSKPIKFIIDEELRYQIIHPLLTFDQMKEYLLQRKEEFLKKYS